MSIQASAIQPRIVPVQGQEGAPPKLTRSQVLQDTIQIVKELCERSPNKKLQKIKKDLPEINEQTCLIKLGFNDLDIVEVAMDLEDKYGISIPDEDLDVLNSDDKNKSIKVKDFVDLVVSN